MQKWQKKTVTPFEFMPVYGIKNEFGSRRHTQPKSQTPFPVGVLPFSGRKPNQDEMFVNIRIVSCWYQCSSVAYNYEQKAGPWIWALSRIHTKFTQIVKHFALYFRKWGKCHRGKTLRMVLIKPDSDIDIRYPRHVCPVSNTGCCCVWGVICLVSEC